MIESSLSIFSSLNLWTVLVAVIVGIITQNLRKRLKYNLPPGPFALPVVGNYEVTRAKCMHEKFEEYIKKYGPVFTIYLGSERTIVLNDIKVVTEALVTMKDDFAERPRSASGDIFAGHRNDDLIFSRYSTSVKLQKKIAGTALRKYMSGYNLERTVHASMSKCLKEMSGENGPFYPEPYIDLMVFNVVDSILFGESFDLDDCEFQRFMKLIKGINELFGKLTEDTYPILIKIRPTAKYRQFQEMQNELTNFFTRRLKEHQDTFNKENIRNLTDALIEAWTEADREHKDASTEFTNDSLVQTILDLFTAALDPVRMTLYFAVRYLAGLPDIQSKIQDELDQAVGRSRMAGIKDIPNLEYGEATLYEVLRLGYVLPTGVPHSTLRDTKVGGFDIPNGTTVIINHWALNHDINYWKDVDTFNPSRYLGSNGKLMKRPESWLPFSAGRRKCLGENVAKPELVMILSALFQRFNIALAPGTNPEIELTGSIFDLGPAKYQITLQERQ